MPAYLQGKGCCAVSYIAVDHMALNGQYSLGTVCRVRHVSGHEHAFKSRAQPGNTMLNAEIGAGAARAAIAQPWIFHPRLIVMQLFSCFHK